MTAVRDTDKGVAERPGLAVARAALAVATIEVEGAALATATEVLDTGQTTGMAAVVAATKGHTTEAVTGHHNLSVKEWQLMVAIASKEARLVIFQAKSALTTTTSEPN
jgi:hypothetical protein